MWILKWTKLQKFSFVHKFSLGWNFSNQIIRQLNFLKICPQCVSLSYIPSKAQLTEISVINKINNIYLHNISVILFHFFFSINNKRSYLSKNLCKISIGKLQWWLNGFLIFIMKYWTGGRKRMEISCNTTMTALLLKIQSLVVRGLEIRMGIPHKLR